MDDDNNLTRKKLQLLFDEETRKLCLFSSRYFHKNQTNKTCPCIFVSLIRKSNDIHRVEYHLHTNFDDHN